MFNFQNSFTVGLGTKFAARALLYFPPHLNCVSTTSRSIKPITAVIPKKKINERLTTKLTVFDFLKHFMYKISKIQINYITVIFFRDNQLASYHKD